jgi:uncharacterized protein (TIGR02145 family)
MKTRNRIWLCLLKIIPLLIIFTQSCSKDEESSEIKDADGNVYTSIKIGTQVWMVENLKTTKFNDGITIIRNVTDDAEWSNLTTPAYCWYSNNITNKTPYGAIYNGYAVKTGKLCPTGWHVPSDTEWATLFDYAGGLVVAGGKLKETGTTHWNSPNTGATDEYGFKYLPGGLRDTYGSMYSLGVVGDYWGNDSQSGGYEYSTGIFYNENSVGTTYYGFKDEGISVRCLKN